MVYNTYEDIIEAIKKIGLKYKDLSIYHFGSRTRNDFKEDSDIDLMLKSDNKESLMYARFELEELISVLRIDISLSDTIEKCIYEDVIKNGIKLC